jgi:hypothetical protein
MIGEVLDSGNERSGLRAQAERIRRIWPFEFLVRRRGLGVGVDGKSSSYITVEIRLSDLMKCIGNRRPW